MAPRSADRQKQKIGGSKSPKAGSGANFAKSPGSLKKSPAGLNKSPGGAKKSPSSTQKSPGSVIKKSPANDTPSNGQQKNKFKNEGGDFKKKPFAKTPPSDTQSNGKVHQTGKGKFGKAIKSEKISPKKEQQSESDDDDDEGFTLDTAPKGMDMNIKPNRKEVKKTRTEEFKPKVQAVSSKKSKAQKGKPVAKASDSDNDDDEDESEAMDDTENLNDVMTKGIKQNVQSDDESEDEMVPAKKAPAARPKLVADKGKKAKSATAESAGKKTTTPEQKAKTEAAQADAAAQKAEKRKKVEFSRAANAKKSRLMSEIDKDVLAENNKRRHDRDNRTIFVALSGDARRVTDTQVKALHPDTLAINRVRQAVFLVFHSEAVRDKAFETMNTKKLHIHGKAIKLDRCGEKGAKARTNPEKDENLINMNQIVVSDVPRESTQDMLSIIFPNADDIFLHRRTQCCFLTFKNVADAKEAFNKGKSLKIGGIPVMVRYRTFSVTDATDITTPKAGGDAKTAANSDAKLIANGKTSKQVKTATKVAQPNVTSSADEEEEEVSDEDGDELNLESGEEGSGEEDDEEVEDEE